MISLKYSQIKENAKSPYTYGSKKNKRILKRIETTLPELMSRNIKLCQELKNKITISCFMNETETKTKKYLQKFVISSRKRVKDIKTGLGLKNVLRECSKKLEPICNNINKDIYIQNGDFLINEKNLISQKINEIKHEKINELIKNIKYIIKPTKLNKKAMSHRIVKSIPEEEMLKIKNTIKDELTNDENILKEKIKYYKHNLLTLAEQKPKNFYKIASNIYFKSKLKMINYTKPSPENYTEPKMLNLLKIRKELLKNREKKEKEKEKEDFDDIYNNNNNYMKKIQKTTLINNKSETIYVIKKLVKDKDKLELKANKNMKRINSMIDFNLPCVSNYYKTIKFSKKFNEKKNLSMITDLERNKRNKKFKFNFNNNDDISKLELIKNEIKNLTHEKMKKKIEDIEKNKKTFPYN